MIAARKRRVIAQPVGFDAEAGARGNTWSRACAGKDRYTSEAAALVGIGLNTRSRTLDVYVCAFCSGYHLTERLPAGVKKAAPIYMLAFVCSRCLVRHRDFAAASQPWTPATRRRALLDLERAVMRDGWSIGAELDHCAPCSDALGIETLRGVA